MSKRPSVTNPWPLGEKALEQVNRTLDEQNRVMDEQSRKSDQAGRFAIAVVLVGIAVLSLLVPMGWPGPRNGLTLVAVLFFAFFVQSGITSLMLVRMSMSSGSHSYVGVGASPRSIVERLKQEPHLNERDLLRAFLVLSARLYEQNDARIANMARKRDVLMSWNLSSITWIAFAVVIYTQEAVKWI